MEEDAKICAGIIRTSANKAQTILFFLFRLLILDYL